MKISNLYNKAKLALAENSKNKVNANKRALGVIGVFVIGSFALAPQLAMAAPWDSAASSVLAIFTGGLARTLAIIAVIACGIAAVAGKLSWDWAIKIIVGIVLIFGATSIVDYVIAASN